MARKISGPELKGSSRPIPVRLDAESDLIIQQTLQERQFNNRNLTINFIIHQFGLVQRERLAAKDRLWKEMQKWGFRPKDFD